MTYAKPRSKPHEQVGEQTLPVYRGDMVNGREAHAEQRRADPQRILKGYAAARNIMRHLAGTPRPGRRRMPRRSGPATRCCCSTTSANRGVRPTARLAPAAAGSASSRVQPNE
ncbi:phenazine biosynthesis protein PhzC [Pseudomonas aeruginosa PA38182]|nr:phenazine biosynthesis protein PhzC [Pseudomonas aeruginosa PA38182]